MKSKFNGLFKLLTGNEPFHWQEALAQRFSANDIPPGCDLPTGMGKTSVIPIWAICLGLQSMAGNVLLPRRLIYTVNRRVIVDQATEEVNRIVQVLSSSNEPAIMDLREALVSLAATVNGSPLAVSTLRGGLADNQEWKLDPTRPAIVIGTVDMIGSKLLFCGYGDGRRERPLHAGLLGEDSLIVHDESHLMPAFGRSLREAWNLNRSRILLQPFAIMDLSATQEGIFRDGLISLGDADLRHPVIRQRAGLMEGRGRKKLNLQIASKKNAAALIAELATRPLLDGSAVLVYVRTVDLAKKVREKLVKVLGKTHEDNVIVLTGTLRGHERDQLTALPAFKRFSPGRDRSQGLAETVYLVSTAAGEVGVNLDADHCICDLSTLESMIQRFGRINRMGFFPESIIEVVAIKEEMAQETVRRHDTRKALNRTWEALLLLGGDASVDNVSRLLRSEGGFKDAYAPSPVTLHLDAWTLDAWSATGIGFSSFPQRPDVSLWLHGKTEEEVPETHIAWRFDIGFFEDLDPSEAKVGIQDYLEMLPVHRQELLKEPSHVVKRALFEISGYWSALGRQFKAILITSDGDVLFDTIGNISDSSALEWATVILPARVGGLSQSGLLDTAPETLAREVNDIANEPGKRTRIVIERIADNWVCQQGTKDSFVVDASSLEEAARLLAKERGYKFHKVLDLTGALFEDKYEPERAIVVLINASASLPGSGDLSACSGQAQTLASHLLNAEAAARHLASELNLPPPITEALCIAAHWHDKGKDRRDWQKAINNPTEEPLAQTNHMFFDRRFTRGYRHEFGSLIDAEESPEISEHPERDLILHLIASHHGHGRPIFSDVAFDRTHPYSHNIRASRAVMERFTSLQARFGWWQLAWLETLVKSADVMSSLHD